MLAHKEILNIRICGVSPFKGWAALNVETFRDVDEIGKCL